MALVVLDAPVQVAVTGAFALLALVGALVAVRLPALSCALLFPASAGGFLSAGAAWLGPGSLLLVAAVLALAAIENPFAGEIERERSARTHDRPA